ncbi:hypothetical protein E4K37_07000 [Neisseria meningitidis]|nr:hypothetical protein [Neisseria meningitidis]MBG8627325.1 hypothetical protein [Neisseria meningitidis]MBG8633754.1 hypothetical protein [Neisseria meningitidis]MBG8660403.1 hypothetical protein [Neisseria meningitidis]MBG8721253.1 hypothetical protein [Neisseria meningitidis]
MPYYLYCLRLRRLVLIFVNPLYECIGVKTSDYFLEAVLVTGRSRECKKCFIKIMGASSFVYQWNNLRLDSEIV